MFDIRTCYICDDIINTNECFVQVEDITLSNVSSRWICKECRKGLKAYLYTERYKKFS